MELESKVVSLSTKVEELEYAADRMEQYSGRNFDSNPWSTRGKRGRYKLLSHRNSERENGFRYLIR